MKSDVNPTEPFSKGLTYMPLCPPDKNPDDPKNHNQTFPLPEVNPFCADRIMRPSAPKISYVINPLINMSPFCADKIMRPSARKISYVINPLININTHAWPNQPRAGIPGMPTTGPVVPRMEYPFKPHIFDPINPRVGIPNISGPINHRVRSSLGWNTLDWNTSMNITRV